MRVYTGIKMRILSAFASDIHRADVDGTGFLTKKPFRNACKTVHYEYFLAYAG